VKRFAIGWAVAGVLMASSPCAATEIGMNVGWTLLNYQTGAFEYDNSYWGTDYSAFGQRGQMPNPRGPVPFGSTDTFWLWGYSFYGLTVYDLSIDLSADVDAKYFVSMFNWRPDSFTLPDQRDNIPATSPLSLTTETHTYRAVANGAGMSTMLLLIRPETGYTWTTDLPFTVWASTIPPEDPGGITIGLRVGHSSTIPVEAAPVPDAGSSLLLLGVGLAAIRGWQRRHP